MLSQPESCPSSRRGQEGQATAQQDRHHRDLDAIHKPGIQEATEELTPPKSQMSLRAPARMRWITSGTTADTTVAVPAEPGGMVREKTNTVASGGNGGAPAAVAIS